MEKLNDYEIKILKKMYEFGGWLSTRQISQKTGYSWETVDHYLKLLLNDRFVENKSSGKKNNWKFNFIRYKKLREELSKK